MCWSLEWWVVTVLVVNQEGLSQPYAACFSKGD